MLILCVRLSACKLDQRGVLAFVCRGPPTDKRQVAMCMYLWASVQHTASDTISEDAPGPQESKWHSVIGGGGVIHPELSAVISPDGLVAVVMVAIVSSAHNGIEGQRCLHPR